MPARGFYHSALAQRIDTLTELNRATSEAYAACVKAGTHRRGERSTRPRQASTVRAVSSDYRPMAICPVCDVPIK